MGLRLWGVDLEGVAVGGGAAEVTPEKTLLISWTPFSSFGQARGHVLSFGEN